MLAARVVPVCRYYRHILCEYVDDTINMYTTITMNLPCQTALLTHLTLYTSAGWCTCSVDGTLEV